MYFLASQCERPRLNISQPGEIRQEYEEFLCREKEENSKQEQKNLMLSQALIKMIEVTCKIVLINYTFLFM